MEIFDKGEKSGNKLNFVVLGDVHVGKTTLFNHYCNCGIGIDALGNPPKTIGMNIHLKKLIIQKNILVAKFYDFCGDVNYRLDLDIFLKLILTSEGDYIGDFPIHGIFLVFDVNLKRTLESLKEWLVWLQETLVRIGQSQGKSSKVVCQDVKKKIRGIPVFILGNKIDKVTNAMSLTMGELGKRGKITAKMDKIIQRVTDHLRRKFAFMDFDNLLFLSKNSDGESLKQIDKLIFSVFAHNSPGEALIAEIELNSFSLERCIGWNRETSGNYFGKGVLKFIRKLFIKEDVEGLPLYSTRNN